MIPARAVLTCLDLGHDWHDRHVATHDGPAMAWRECRVCGLRSNVRSEPGAPLTWPFGARPAPQGVVR